MYTSEDLKIFMDDFVKVYSSFYLKESPKPYDNKDYLGDGEVRAVQQEVEKVADNALEKKDIPWTAEEWKTMGWKLVAWKVGTLKYDESGDCSWNKRTVRGIPIQGIDHYLENIKNDCNRLSNLLLEKRDNKNVYEQLQKAYNRLLELQVFDEKKRDEIKKHYDVKNFGPVYILTLIYFLSKGRFPIYDQFAHRAAKALYLNAKPDDVYILSEGDKTKVNSVLRMYNEYCWLLSQIFGKYEIDRNEDQALWVYGHSKKKYPAQKQPLWLYGQSEKKHTGENTEYNLFNFDRAAE